MISKNDNPFYVRYTIFHMQQDSKELTHLIVGYALIALGVFVMFLSSIQVYRVFTKQAEPVQYFDFPSVKIDLTKMAPKIDTSGLDELKKQLNLRGNETSTVSTSQETEILPSKVLNDPANLTVFILFMGFVLNFGYKIADLGIKLVRPVYIKANS